MIFQTNFSREQLFKLMAILLPFVALGLAELGLRAGGYGYDTHLFVADEAGTFYCLNPAVSKKYFTIEENATIGNREFFPMKKDPRAVRLFVLGASSSLGFPYMHNGAFPRLLKYRLQMAYPETVFEVVNLSLTAVNSYTLADFAKQLAAYEPDAVLVYAGHNEYYGALGVASSSRLGRYPGWIDACLAMREWKLGQLVFRLAGHLRGTDKRLTDYSRTLMERMARQQAVAYGSEAYRRGIRQFDRNMRGLLGELQAKKIPVVIGTLVSAERGLPPLEGGSGAWPDAGRFPAPAGSLAAVSVPADTCGAAGWYAKGEAAYAKAAYAEAKHCYIRAKEYDAIRFRAPEAMNRLIRSYAGQPGEVYLADVRKAFEAHAPHGILDSTLLLEHVHPTLAGQRLICETYYRTLEETGLLASVRYSKKAGSLRTDKRGGRPAAWGNSVASATPANPVAPVTFSDYPLLAFDSIFGGISTALLKELWPFYQPLPDEEPDPDRSYEEQLAGACAVRQISWYEAVQRLYTDAMQRDDVAYALQIMESICLEFPYQEGYWRQAGRLSLRLGDDRKACFYFVKRYALRASAEAAADLAVAWLTLDKPEAALPYLESAVRDGNSRVNFSPMKRVVEQIAGWKQRLSLSPSDTALAAAIAAAYRKIGNTKVARAYERVAAGNAFSPTSNGLPAPGNPFLAADTLNPLHTRKR